VGIVGTSKMIIVATLIAGVIVVLALGYFNTRSISKVLGNLVGEAQRLSSAAVDGKLQTRGNPELVTPEFRPIVEGVNATLDAIIGPLNVAAEYVDRISKGDIPAKITDSYNGDFNEIKNNLNQCIDAVNAMSADATLLAKAAIEGRLAIRADAAKHQGDFRKIVQGVNDTLDAVIGPLNVAAHYVDEISKGEIPAKISDNYNGDFNTIKNNLNQCIDAVNALVADANMLSDAAVEGRLSTRADAAKHQGDFRKVVEGVNETIDSLVGHIDAMPNPTLIIDREMGIRYINKAAADVIGLPSQQILGTKCFSHFKTSDCRTDKCVCARAMRDGRPSTSETDAHPGQHNLEINYTGMPVKDRKGQIIGALEFVADQTAIKRAARMSSKVATYQETEVGKVAALLEEIAKGDLTQQYCHAHGDEDTSLVAQSLATLGKALNGTINNLRSMI
jgi:methyl-accepting chemotaxis protein